jgi:hypothetical protein
MSMLPKQFYDTVVLGSTRARDIVLARWRAATQADPTWVLHRCRGLPRDQATRRAFSKAARCWCGNRQTGSRRGCCASLLGCLTASNGAGSPPPGTPNRAPRGLRSHGRRSAACPDQALPAPGEGTNVNLLHERRNLPSYRNGLCRVTPTSRGVSAADVSGPHSDNLVA